MYACKLFLLCAGVSLTHITFLLQSPSPHTSVPSFFSKLWDTDIFLIENPKRRPKKTVKSSKIVPFLLLLLNIIFILIHMDQNFYLCMQRSTCIVINMYIFQQ